MDSSASRILACKTDLGWHALTANHALQHRMLLGIAQQVTTFIELVILLWKSTILYTKNCLDP